jgi:uncharacterized protein (DUF58 family)
MKSAFALLLVALLTLPALATARIMVWRTKRRLRAEREEEHRRAPDGADR